jgi:paraquat-inducible protein A
VTTLIACRDCGEIQQMPPPPRRGKLECWQCGRVLERTSGRSLDRALACSVTTLLLLFPANILPFLTVQVAGISRSTHLAGGLPVAWHQGWPLVAITLGLFGVILPFVRFGLLSATLAAIRSGIRGPQVGTIFRFSEILDLWAMADVLLIGAGIGYGRVASQIPVRIDAGGWCFVAAAFMTMITRASLERRAVWRSLQMPPSEVGPNPVACTSCDLVLPGDAEGQRCPRCTARIYRRRPFSLTQCAALTLACWVLMPISYGYPMSEIWEAGTVHPHGIINGTELLFEHGFWYFGIIIFLVSIIFPFSKLIGLTWFMLSMRRHSSAHLRQKTELYRFIDEVGRWSVLDPFTVMVFAPMVQFEQVAHIDFMGGAPAFLATVVLSMLAAWVFDPRLIWDAAMSGSSMAEASVGGATPSIQPT